MKRFLAVFLMALGLLVFLNAVQANAGTKVDSKKQIPRYARDDKSKK